MAERFALVFTQRRILPLALGVALVGAVFSTVWWARLGCVAVAGLAAIAAWWQARAKPALIVDERGYAVEEHGREKLRVAWSEVVRVRADRAESALYVDCGDPARNLLVPPRRGFGFRFERAERLYALIVSSVQAERVEAVDRLDPKPQKGPAR
jgi:hypothetical protein